MAMGVAMGVLVLAGAGAARASGDVEPRWELSASTSTGTPPVLSQGLALGAMAEIERRARGLPLFLSARLGWSRASAANQSWIIEHDQLLAAAGVGVGAGLGAGRIWAQAGGGASGLYEVLSRHQRQRIDSAGVRGGVKTALSLGIYGYAEIGVAVRLRGAVSGLLAAGPTLARTTVDRDPLWRLGAAARLGVALAF